jgi:hypothetical protein
MLDKLRAEALALIAATTQCTLSTMGPAGVQAAVVECLVRDHGVYLLVPSTSDQLFNIEYHTEMVLTTRLWQLRGAAQVLAKEDGRQASAPHDLVWGAHGQGYRVVAVFPLRMHIEPGGHRRYAETIDFELSSRPGGQPVARRATEQARPRAPHGVQPAQDSEDSLNR